jgi:CRP/FNR family cyclic AMP-dependent transcriptional regulator
MADQDTIEMLRGIRLFAGLPDKSLREIASQMREHHFDAGTTVIDEDSGSTIGRMYVITSGTAQVVVGEQVVTSFGKGDHFGEMSVLDGKPRSASVIAVSDLETIGLSSWNLRSLIVEEPEIAMHLISELASRIRADNMRHTD